MKYRNATIHELRARVVEKAVLKFERYEVDAPDPFSVQVSYYVPVAKAKKPMPKCAVVISCGSNVVRVVSGEVSELWEMFSGVVKFLEEQGGEYQDIVDREQARWRKLHGIGGCDS